MADIEKKVEKPAPVPEPPQVLADGAASTDAAVQSLLAERHTAVMNGDDAAAKAITAQLAELGYR
jgi:hypothetical protein